LTHAVERISPRPGSPQTRRFLARLDRRLRALEALASGDARAVSPLRELSPSAAARRFLARFEGSWDDGDETLVRGYLDRWVRPGQDPALAAARGLSEAALALSRVQTRPATLWFFLWEMESVMEGWRAVRPRRPRRPGAADRASEPC
jgi:uncharacterized membrane-anchored protein